MLHSILDSTGKDQLMKVVAMQEMLVKAICVLPPKKKIGLPWLKSVWKGVAMDWVERFWNNDKGQRAKWLIMVSASSKKDKATMLGLWKQQMQFPKLYKAGSKFRLDPCDGKNPVMAAMRDLLTSFYAPLFYSDEGFPDAKGVLFHKDHFISGFTPKVRVCPYTDYPIPIDAAKLDHFLPKERFPALSCHPDNLFPCSTDANNGGRKGTKVPLDLAAKEQAATWFHPRLRPAKDTYRLEFSNGPTPQPQVKFVARAVADQSRLDNLNAMFKLTDSWGEYLDDGLQELSNAVSGMLTFANKDPSFVNVREAVVTITHQRIKDRSLGRRPLAISESFFYEHIANSAVLLKQVQRACEQGT